MFKGEVRSWSNDYSIQDKDNLAIYVDLHPVFLYSFKIEETLIVFYETWL